MYFEREENPKEVLQSEVGNRGSKSRQVITDNCKGGAILDNHIGRSHGIERVDHQGAGATLDTEDHALAVLRCRECRAGSAVVVEEAVQAGSVDVNVLAVEYSETKGVTVPTEAAAVARVVQGRVGWVRAVGCIWIGLVVPEKWVSLRNTSCASFVGLNLRRLGLNESCHD